MLSNRVNLIKPSPTIAVSNRAKELKDAGHDVIGLGAGEPDFDTPDHIKQAAIDAIQNGDTKYTAVDGTPQLKKAIIDKLKNENGFDYNAKQILVSCGAKHSLFNVFQALIGPGDEAIIPAPYWVSYPDMVKLCEGTPVIVDCKIDNQFRMTAEQLEQAITDKTKLLVLCSPSNPSGSAYSEAELAALGTILAKHPQITVVTDDIYEHILWTDKPFVNILNASPELYDQTVVINGVSKVFAMTGWRIGYAAGPEKLIGAMKKIQSQSTSNPCSIAQAASAAALSGDQSCITDMVRNFKERHDYVVDRLSNIKGVKVIPSDGTFYTFPDFSQAIADSEVDNDVDYAALLLEKAGVALVPGSAFGSEGHLRISYATDMDTLKNALDRIETFANQA
ncbi:MAG: pyridoxal phosphate-dependent aminotransferase [Arenicella sp.]